MISAKCLPRAFSSRVLCLLWFWTRVGSASICYAGGCRYQNRHPLPPAYYDWFQIWQSLESVSTSPSTVDLLDSVSFWDPNPSFPFPELTTTSAGPPSYPTCLFLFCLQAEVWSQGFEGREVNLPIYATCSSHCACSSLTVCSVLSSLSISSFSLRKPLHSVPFPTTLDVPYASPSCCPTRTCPHSW